MAHDVIADVRISTTSDCVNQSRVVAEKDSIKDTSNAPNAPTAPDTVTAEIDSYPNVFRRTIIVVGVALALFLVRQ